MVRITTTLAALGWICFSASGVSAQTAQTRLVPADLRPALNSPAHGATVEAGQGAVCRPAQAPAAPARLYYNGVLYRAEGSSDPYRLPATGSWRPTFVGQPTILQKPPAWQAPAAVPSGYYYGRGLIGQPKLYVPRQPVRNFLRYISP